MEQSQARRRVGYVCAVSDSPYLRALHSAASRVYETADPRATCARRLCHPYLHASHRTTTVTAVPAVPAAPAAPAAVAAAAAAALIRPSTATAEAKRTVYRGRVALWLRAASHHCVTLGHLRRRCASTTHWPPFAATETGETRLSAGPDGRTDLGIAFYTCIGASISLGPALRTIFRAGGGTHQNAKQRPANAGTAAYRVPISQLSASRISVIRSGPTAAAHPTPHSTFSRRCSNPLRHLHTLPRTPPTWCSALPVSGPFVARWPPAHRCTCSPLC
ncbi:MAG: hypothetical protein FE78DRAFT_231565 [Acidomyces sp. 'richmondensis']|nr:MAG: hypothetical protein FE78DRAFT_231565 [Acidomyces sp. 'richmondensis']